MSNEFTEDLAEDMRIRNNEIKERIQEKYDRDSYHFLRSNPFIDPKESELSAPETIHSYLKFFHDSEKDVPKEMKDFFDEIMDIITCEFYYGDLIHDEKEILEKAIDTAFDQVNEMLETSSKIGQRIEEYKKGIKDLKDKTSFLVEGIIKYVEKRNFEKTSVLTEWLDDSRERIESAQDDFSGGRYKNGIKNLHEGLEFLVKIYAMYWGEKGENEVREEIGHNPLNFYIDLVKNEKIMDITTLFLDEKNNPSEELVSKLEDMRDRIQEGEITKGEILEFDNLVPFFMRIYRKYLEDFNKEISFLAENTDLRKFDTDKYIEEIKKESAFVSPFLLPFSTLLSVYYPSRYADKRRELDMNLKDTKIIENWKSIIDIIKENIDNLESIMDEDLDINLNLVFTSDISDVLKDISGLSEEKKFNKIENIFHKLRRDGDLRNFLEEINSFQWVENLETKNT